MAAPDFDTYHCLEKYARHPCRVNAIAMEALVYRTGLRLIYEVGSDYKSTTSELAERAFNLRIGKVEKTSGSTLSAKDVHDMTDDERMALYIQACRSAGIDISEEDIIAGKLK